MLRPKPAYDVPVKEVSANAPEAAPTLTPIESLASALLRNSQEIRV